MIFIPFSIEESIIPCSCFACFVPVHPLKPIYTQLFPWPLSYVTQNYEYIGLQVPAVMFLFHCLSRSLVRCFIWWYVLRCSVVSISPNPQAVKSPHVGFPWLLIQCIRSYRPYLEYLLPPQPENPQCLGERERIIMVVMMMMMIIIVIIIRKKPCSFENRKAFWKYILCWMKNAITSYNRAIRTI
jgi:hypothetical protein